MPSTRSVKGSKHSNITIEQKFDFDDVLIQPSTQTDIESRYNEIDPYVSGTQPLFIPTNGLPLFTAPMDTVVDTNTLFKFRNNGITVVLPRTVKHKKFKFAFNSFSLTEFENEIEEMSPSDEKWPVLIDIANGHMSKVISCAKEAKKRNPEIIIMAGNIANPETYRLYCESGVIDYARIGIGNGNGCLTTQQTGIGYPMGSLIAECNEIKKTFPNATKIVADGGMKKYSDIIRALALGADYVMIGSIFNKALESAAPTYWYGIRIPNSLGEWMLNKGYNLYKEFRGMSTKKSQTLMGNTKLRTSEGVVKRQKVEYTISSWTENFESYYRSALSYANCKSSAEFIGKVKYNFITQNSFNRYNK